MKVKRTQKTNKNYTENNDRRKCRQDGDNSRRFKKAKNQIDRMEKEKDGKYSWTEGLFCTMKSTHGRMEVI